MVLVDIRTTKSFLAKELEKDDYQKKMSKSKGALEDTSSKLEALAVKVAKSIKFAEKKQRKRKMKGEPHEHPCSLFLCIKVYLYIVFI